MLILVQVRSKEDVLPAEQKVCGCSLVLSSLGEYVAQVQTSSGRTIVCHPNSILHLRRDVTDGGVH